MGQVETQAISDILLRFDSTDSIRRWAAEQDQDELFSLYKEKHVPEIFREVLLPLIDWSKRSRDEFVGSFSEESATALLENPTVGEEQVDALVSYGIESIVEGDFSRDVSLDGHEASPKHIFDSLSLTGWRETFLDVRLLLELLSSGEIENLKNTGQKTNVISHILERSPALPESAFWLIYKYGGDSWYAAWAKVRELLVGREDAPIELKLAIIRRQISKKAPSSAWRLVGKLVEDERVLRQAEVRRVVLESKNKEVFPLLVPFLEKEELIPWLEKMGEEATERDESIFTMGAGNIMLYLLELLPDESFSELPRSTIEKLFHARDANIRKKALLLLGRLGELNKDSQ